MYAEHRRVKAFDTEFYPDGLSGHERLQPVSVVCDRCKHSVRYYDVKRDTRYEQMLCSSCITMLRLNHTIGCIRNAYNMESQRVADAQYTAAIDARFYPDGLSESRMRELIDTTCSRCSGRPHDTFYNQYRHIRTREPLCSGCMRKLYIDHVASRMRDAYHLSALYVVRDAGHVCVRCNGHAWYMGVRLYDVTIMCHKPASDGDKREQQTRFIMCSACIQKPIDTQSIIDIWRTNARVNINRLVDACFAHVFHDPIRETIVDALIADWETTASRIAPWKIGSK